uniref:Uncharacterized protein n=1 Tax=Oryza sativa subsp. japonica TaxID=39947 RepID=Q7F0Q6_ORYSJ|nr:hypothetical protein [Oryza sativa Japonica Group]BAD30452.1 hypothetical protein [Oryza sativa Japonica Group]
MKEVEAAAPAPAQAGGRREKAAAAVPMQARGWREEAAAAAPAQARGWREEAAASPPDPLTAARAPPLGLAAATPCRRRRQQGRCQLAVSPFTASPVVDPWRRGEELAAATPRRRRDQGRRRLAVSAAPSAQPPPH